MDPSAARDAIAAALARVAPDVDLDLIDPTDELRVEADLDSMDFLHLVEALAAAAGVDIPERDYPRTDTLDSFVAYLVEVTGG